jgi:D-serine deaminase-like pyridoxal phosphate-dependent protein
MERPLFKPVGTPAQQLDTPALVVDVAMLEHNLRTVHTAFGLYQARLRPHASAHRCPMIAHRQLAAGGTVDGLSVTTVGEAEVFAAHGCRNLFLTNAVVTPVQLQRLCALARQATLTVPVDHPRHVHALTAAASRHGVELQVVVDVRTHTHGCGITPGQPAIDLARTIQQAPGLQFLGLTASAAPLASTDPAALASATRQGLQAVLATRKAMISAGLPVSLVSIGGTPAYEAVATLEGVTEIRAGTYALMDAGHADAMPALQPAARVLTTVISRPDSDTAITDCGQKAMGIDRGLPVVADLVGAVPTGLSAEHARLRLENDAARQLAVGEKIWLTPWDISTCVNLYDFMYAVRAGVLEAVWSVTARGHYV